MRMRYRATAAGHQVVPARAAVGVAIFGRTSPLSEARRYRFQAIAVPHPPAVPAASAADAASPHGRAARRRLLRPASNRASAAVARSLDDAPGQRVFGHVGYAASAVAPR